jgi:hypothetical protein
VSDLSWWFAPHPEWEPTENWPEEVLCARLETEDEVVLIDPLEPAEPTRGKRVRVLLTAPWHDRGTAEVVDRYGASVWAPPDARWQGPPLTTTSELPDGVEALLPPGEPNQALFFLPEHRTLVTGDVFSGTGGRFHVFVDEADPEVLLPWLDGLAELAIDRVLIAHGEPVLANGAERIRAAVAEARLTNS